MGSCNKRQGRRFPRGMILALALVIVFMTACAGPSADGPQHNTGPQRVPAQSQTQPGESQTVPAESQTVPAESQTVPAETLTEPTEAWTEPTEEQIRDPWEEDEEELPPEDAVVFPAVLEDGCLEVESVFQFSGINPDAGRQEATDAAAIVLRNTSGAYLESAQIWAVFHDGTEHLFEVYDLPAGEAAMAFSIDNSELPDGSVCTELFSEAVFEEPEGMDAVSVSVDGITLTLRNISGRDLAGIDVYCRDVFNDNYFGGVAYMYTIDELSAGESTTVTVPDSILGVVEVVRIVVND